MQMLNEMGKDPKVEKFFKELLEKLEKNPPKDENAGYNALMQDLTDLVKEAYDYEFDDFRNKKYATPKVILREKLLKMADNVVNGKYDN